MLASCARRFSSGGWVENHCSSVNSRFPATAGAKAKALTASICRISRVGMVAMYFRTPDGQVGQVERADDDWAWVVRTDESRALQVSTADTQPRHCAKSRNIFFEE